MRNFKDIDAYIEAAISNARYEPIENGKTVYAEIPGFPGVWASGSTREESGAELRKVLEGLDRPSIGTPPSFAGDSRNQAARGFICLTSPQPFFSGNARLSQDSNQQINRNILTMRIGNLQRRSPFL